MRLESHVQGRWTAGSGNGRPLHNPVTGEVIGHADATGIDIPAALAFAREAGGAALAALTFAERGALLKAIADTLTAHREKYGEIARINSGNTAADAAIDIDGGIGTLRYYARLGQSLGAATAIIEAGEDQLTREAVFFARHLWTTRPGVAVQINAFNFPSWGMWEKIAVALLAGAPSLAKPATATAWLAHEMMRDVIAAGVAPPGVLSIVCGGGETIADALQPMDSLAFTGSCETGRRLRSAANILLQAPRIAIEADSVNATIIGPDAAPGAVVHDLAVREIVKALSVKAGQLCTNIRRIFVPQAMAGALAQAITEKLAQFPAGDPADPSVRIGPLVDAAQRDEALRRIERLTGEASVVTGGGIPAEVVGADPRRGAFLSPTLLHCEKPREGALVHEIEVFGPCATLMPYAAFDDAIAMAGGRAGGSLAVSIFTNDAAIAGRAVQSLSPWHGRVLVVDEEAGKNHTGHAMVMPQCVHGGPGRAGGGEELGGLRGLRLHMQRTAIQGSRSLLQSLAGVGAQAAL
jgi:3,4-dehydroadipyl-CoA semialdehyde dehydrogenase